MPDAGRGDREASPARTAAELAAAHSLMQRWLAALEPVLRKQASSGSSRGRPPTKAPVAGAVDAGVAAPQCIDGPLRVRIDSAPIDLVIAIDVSGSMGGRLPEVDRWLTHTLEPAIRGLDVQLQLVLDPVELRRTMRREPTWKPSDAGTTLALEVGSHDALAVLLEAATDPLHGAWLTKLRPGSRAHIVVVTDDDPTPRLAKEFEARLSKVSGGRTFQFDALLGIKLEAPWTLGPDEPESWASCAVAPGFEYQAIAKRTEGLRGSVCYRESFEAFTSQLLERDSTDWTCTTSLPSGVERVGQVAAGGRNLTPALDLWKCEQQADHYMLWGGKLVICPPTCKTLRAAGINAVSIELRCASR